MERQEGNPLAKKIFNMFPPSIAERVSRGDRSSPSWPIGICSHMLENVLSCHFCIFQSKNSKRRSQGIRALQVLQAIYPDKLKYVGIPFREKNDLLEGIPRELKGTNNVAYSP
jgi:hypothetical protein